MKVKTVLNLDPCVKKNDQGIDGMIAIAILDIIPREEIPFKQVMQMIWNLIPECGQEVIHRQRPRLRVEGRF